ncbi:MAG: hypothetical protein ACJ76Z_00850 [Thermoleophilaceae bacterium]
MAVPIAVRLRPVSRPSALLAAALALAGCGGGHHAAAARVHHAAPPQHRATAPPKESTPHLRPAPDSEVAVVRAWSDSLRAGRVKKASSYFALPAIVQNGGDPLTLRTRFAVRYFNASLPCGARVVRGVTAGGHYIIVTFRLTERKGVTPGCGSGTGQLAATAFAFRHGKISEWRRVIPSRRAPAGPSA